MTELDQRGSPWNDGLGISSEFLDHQLYILGCMINADPSLDSLGDNHSLIALRTQFQETEIGRILLTVAVAIRNAMDQNPRRAEYWLQALEDNVGTLMRAGNSNPVLSFREACNKLIHCLSINFDYVSGNPKRGMALTPHIHLYGTKGNDEWKATIDVNRFIQVATQLT